MNLLDSNKKAIIEGRLESIVSEIQNPAINNIDNTKFFNNGIVNYFSSIIENKLFDGVLVINNIEQLFLKNSHLIFQSFNETEITQDKNQSTYIENNKVNLDKAAIVSDDIDIFVNAADKLVGTINNSQLSNSTQSVFVDINSLENDIVNEYLGNKRQNEEGNNNLLSF